MAGKHDNCEIEEIAAAVFRALREMDARCPKGLCYFKSLSPYAGKKGKNEAAMTWGLTQALANRWHIEQREHAYPAKGGRCDRVLELADGGRVWLEVKHAWRSWFDGVVMNNVPFLYNGYFTGAHHSHSVAGDFAKMERIGRTHARYVALLVVGFDGRDGKMGEDMTELVHREKVLQRGWRVLADAWPTRQSGDCWHRCWFSWRAPQ